jgi:hypothetical protein
MTSTATVTTPTSTSRCSPERRRTARPPARAGGACAWRTAGLSRWASALCQPGDAGRSPQTAALPH